MKNCLNCNNETINNYCSVCGQSNSTHRFSLKHFFLHDFVHGIFHLDKGFLFTLKELFTRPGHSIREYVQGKRVEHFNYFTLMLIIIASGHFLSKIPKVSLGEMLETTNLAKGQLRVLREYGKIAILAGVPFYALGTYLVFFKSKQNYTEHLVLTMYFTSGILVLHMIPLIAALFIHDASILLVLSRLSVFLEFIYYYWFLHQYFSVFYKNKVGFAFRCLGVLFVLLAVNLFVAYTINKIGEAYLM